jgi:hypothetical protein
MDNCSKYQPMKLDLSNIDNDLIYQMTEKYLIYVSHNINKIKIKEMNKFFISIMMTYYLLSKRYHVISLTGKNMKSVPNFDDFNKFNFNNYVPNNNLKKSRYSRENLDDLCISTNHSDFADSYHCNKYSNIKDRNNKKLDKNKYKYEDISDTSENNFIIDWTNSSGRTSSFDADNQNRKLYERSSDSILSSNNNDTANCTTTVSNITTESECDNSVCKKNKYINTFENSGSASNIENLVSQIEELEKKFENEKKKKVSSNDTSVPDKKNSSVIKDKCLTKKDTQKSKDNCQSDDSVSTDFLIQNYHPDDMVKTDDLKHNEISTEQTMADSELNEALEKLLNRLNSPVINIIIIMIIIKVIIFVIL